jgi:hypothetical protein
MKNKNKNRKPYTEMELKELFDWIANTRITPDDLVKIISRKDGNEGHQNQLTPSCKKRKKRNIGETASFNKNQGPADW